MDADELDSWAAWYDLMYSGKEHGDVQFYVEEAKAAEDPVLEIGVGTGRIYLELLDAGVDARGIDLSGEMLAQLRAEAAERGLEPQVEQADMRSFSLDRSFDRVFLPFRTFLHNLTTEDQLQTLQRCREHLTDEGRLVLNVFYPTPDIIAEEYGTEREIDLGNEYDDYRLVDRTAFADPVDQLVNIERQLYRDGDLVWEGELQLALVYKREFELLLELAGFSDWTVYGGFDRQPLESPDQEMVWVAAP